MGRVQAPPANIPGTYREVAWTGRGGSWRLISAGIWGVLVDEGIAGVRDSDRGGTYLLVNGGSFRLIKGGGPLNKKG